MVGKIRDRIKSSNIHETRKVSNRINRISYNNIITYVTYVKEVKPSTVQIPEKAATEAKTPNTAA